MVMTFVVGDVYLLYYACCIIILTILLIYEVCVSGLEARFISAFVYLFVCFFIEWAALGGGMAIDLGRTFRPI